ncbi:hypothetical protein [Nocardioides albus]|uniref:Uncharacterized protein n=1 Tax=Nocardioides albus TaxID=1841 RepID=A0A7W5F7C2_9ACTN|nr:hypothetical protein [Nocardioides albus]MBB3087968.1 hypothetical protein [Nocardioides albus]
MMTSRPLSFAALAIAATLTVSACSSGEKPTADPTNPSESPSPVAESSAATVPSDWQTVDLDGVAEISVPPDWTVKSTGDALDTLQAPKDSVGFPPGSATVGVGNLAGGDQSEQLERSANYELKTTYAGYTNLKRLPNEVINDTTFFRLQFEGGADWYDVYGTVTPDGEYSIVFQWKFMKTLDRKQAEAIWSPVMPTFKML